MQQYKNSTSSGLLFLFFSGSEVKRVAGQPATCEIIHLLRISSHLFHYSFARTHQLTSGTFSVDSDIWAACDQLPLSAKACPQPRDNVQFCLEVALSK